jgi:capsular exopolysaccharide synthesis family protein
LHKTFGIPSTGSGVSKAIVTGSDATSMVVESGVPSLWLLPCGMTPPNPAELLHAERFRRIIAELSERFDRVIFDSPPVGAVTDAAILARLVDGVVLVAKGGSTRREALRRARHQLGDSNVNVLGCILNDLDLSKHGTYGYYYYYSKYGGYYDDDSKTAPVKESSGG